MSTTASPSPNTSQKPPSAAMRYLFLFLIGLVMGVVATVMAVRAIDARSDHYPMAVMTVMQAHVTQLKASTDANRCSATDVLPHLESLRTVSNDIEVAFKDEADDERFGKHASALRATLDSARTSPPLNCAGVSKMAERINGDCKACHQDFRS